MYQDKRHDEQIDAMRELTGVLLDEIVAKQRMSIDEWNEKIAPKMTNLGMKIDGVTVTSKTYKQHKSLYNFDGKES
jgi:membrane protease subunit (stomatin/prohibitin family)